MADEELKVVELSEQQVADVQERLEQYDYERFPLPVRGKIRVGIEADGKLVAGVDAEMTSFRILYVSSLYVDAPFRRRGLGRKLMEIVEDRAKDLGANLIRLDTFDWQGPDFYKSLGYEQVGHYSAPEDGFEESFFLKRLD